MRSGHKRQQGIATLLTVLVLMLLATMVVVTASRLATTGEATFGYERDYIQGFRYAEEGLRYAQTKAQNWSIDASNSVFVCASSQTTYSVASRYNATVTCNSTLLTMVSSGTSNSANLNEATALTRTSYKITSNTTTVAGPGMHQPLVVTGDAALISNNVSINISDINGNTDKWGLGGSLSSPGNSGHDSGITNYTTLTQAQINNYLSLTSYATVTLTEPSNGQLCTWLQTQINSYAADSVIQINLTGSDKGFTLSQCSLSNSNSNIPTLLFNGDVDLQGKAVTFTDLNVLVLGQMKNVQNLTVIGSYGGVDLPTTTTLLTSTFKQGSWIDY
jgi:Tfp pilus assembly protein PilX